MSWKVRAESRQFRWSRWGRRIKKYLSPVETNLEFDSEQIHEESVVRHFWAACIQDKQNGETRYRVSTHGKGEARNTVLSNSLNKQSFSSITWFSKFKPTTRELSVKSRLRRIHAADDRLSKSPFCHFTPTLYSSSMANYRECPILTTCIDS